MRPYWYVDFSGYIYAIIQNLITIDDILMVVFYFLVSEKPPSSASIATIVLEDIKDGPPKSTNQPRQTVGIGKHKGSIYK